ncbi:MAG: DUF2298 domain-containing protein [Methanomicrobiales archaeon]|nr:DUF2298 domain-containing protein [Methanomicrobiales archaeon]
MAVEDQFIWVLCWIGLLKLIQLCVFPSLDRAFGEVSGAISYSIALLLFSLSSWYAGLLRLPLQMAILPFVPLSVFGFMRGFFTVERMRRQLRWDLIFVAAFLLLLLVRFLNPSISFAEKFMDHAFLASIMRMPLVPPLDPWYAGGFLNIYYYLGYWTLGALGILTGIPSTVVFNLALPTFFALAVLNAYALGCVLLERYRWLPMAMIFIVNPAFMKELLTGAGLSSAMWNSTRVIEGTINEFPFFSFLWGDVHPHVMGIFNQLLLMVLLVYGYRKWPSLHDRSRCLIVALCALSLGSMSLLNTWDIFIYGPLVLFAFTLILFRDGGHVTFKYGIQKYFPLFGVPILAILIYLPYYLQIQPSGISGVFLVELPSDISRFLLVHGIFLSIFYMVIFEDLRKRPFCLIVAVPFILAGYHAAAIAVVPFVCLITRRPLSMPELLGAFGLATMLIPEMIYLKDGFGIDYFRMNTVFKFYSAGWVLSAVSTGCFAGRWFHRLMLPATARLILKTMGVAILIIAFAAPLFFDLDYGYGGGTLDGAQYLKGMHPGDADAIAFLRGWPGNITLLEAAGGDYTYYSRVSSFTGIPAVIGQPGHEYMWRGAEAAITERVRDVRTMYEDPSEAPELFDRYHVDLVYVGELERQSYRLSLPSDLLEAIYEEGDVTIYRVVRG